MDEVETKVLPLALTKEQRRRLGVMAADRCVAMTELVRWWIDEKWGGHVGSPVTVKTSVVEQKPVSKESGYVDLNKVPVVVDEAPENQLEAPWHVCFGCKDNCPEHLMTYHSKTMKWWCNDCVDKQRNGQA